MFNPFQAAIVFSLFIGHGAWAQDTATSVWRCGNEYTNQPKTGQVCSKVQVQAEVVTTAPRKFHAVPANTSPPVPMSVLVDGTRINSAPPTPPSPAGPAHADR